MRKYFRMVLALMFIWAGGVRPVRAALSAGDIAIIGISCDNPDEISFIVLNDVAQGEIIHFTDNGWRSDGVFRAGEGVHDYIVPAGGFSAGQVVFLSLSGPALSTAGDQVLAYQGDDNSPTFLYAVNLEGHNLWQADAIDTHTSSLPSGLVNGTTAIALPEADNAVFDTSLLSSAAKSEWLALIGNADHWIISNDPIPLPATTSSGVDLRAYQAADGVYVEFTVYDVEVDGSIMLAWVGAKSEILWSGSVNVTAGSQSVARFLVPGLVRGESYNFLVRDEVGTWWDADGVTVASFESEAASATFNGITVTFDCLPDHAYTIQWAAELGGEWQTVTNVTANATQTSVVVAYPEGGEAAGFFRVQAQ